MISTEVDVEIETEILDLLSDEDGDINVGDALTALLYVVAGLCCQAQTQTPHDLATDFAIKFRRAVTMPAGLSIAEIVDQAGAACGVSRLARGADVTIDGHAILPGLWHRVRVKPGHRVMIRARAGNFGGNIFRSLLMLALAVIAPWAGGLLAGTALLGLTGAAATAAASAIAGAIMVAGGLLINALFPPSQTKSLTSTPSYSISARKNAAAKWGPIPSVLGKTRAAPKYAAAPYTEFVGNDQYLRMLFVWGYGPIKITDIRIGDTPIGEFGDVEIETREGWPDDEEQTLYPTEVVQDDLSIEPSYNEPEVRTSAEDAAEIVLDFVAPSGLVNVDDDDGDRHTLTVQFLVEMREHESGDGFDAKGTVTLTGRSNDVIRKSERYVTGGGQWDVRVTRITPEYSEDIDADSVVWTALKTIRTDPPINFSKPLAVTALRIRATKQLNGAIDDLTGVVSTVATSWDGDAWTADQETRNPADLFRLVLQGPANARAQQDSRIDLATLAAWAEVCTSKGFTFDMYRDFTASVRDTLKDIAAAGRAVPIFRDGRWSVAWEESDAPVVQHFTPRNSRDFTWTQAYRVLPHGLRCKFVNAEKDYVEDEMLVFDEGYDENNATLYEQAEFPGVTKPALIYKHAQYRIADAHERPAVYTTTVDFEHLVAQRGDRVAVAHDVIMQGMASGRIKAVAGQALTIDEPAVMEAGKSYGIRIRRVDGTSVVRAVVTDPGTQHVIAIVGDVPDPGDLYTFGLSGSETGIYRVLAIRPGEELSAQVDLVDDGDNVQAGDDETDIPAPVRPAPGSLADFAPRNLRVSSAVIEQVTGSIYRTTLSWNAVPGPEYRAFEVVAVGEGDNLIRRSVDGATQAIVFDSLEEGAWSFTVRALLTDGRWTPASDAFVTTVTVPAGEVGVGLTALRGDFKELQEYAGDRARETIDQVLQLSAAVAQANLGGFATAQQIRREAKVTSDRITASYEEKITVAFGEADGKITTLAAQYEALKAQVDGDIAEAISTVQTQVNSLNGAVTANADAIDTLSTTVGGISSSITVRTTAETSPGDGWARYALRVVVDENGTLSEALHAIDVKPGLARQIWTADEFWFGDPDDEGNLVNPVGLVDGVFYLKGLKVDGADVKEATIGSLALEDGAIANQSAFSDNNSQLLTAATTVASVGFTPEDGLVNVHASFAVESIVFLENYIVSREEVKIEILRDASVIYTTTVAVFFTQAVPGVAVFYHAFGPIFPVTFIDTSPGTSGVTYSLRLTPVWGHTVPIRDIYLSVLNLKKATSIPSEEE